MSHYSSSRQADLDAARARLRAEYVEALEALKEFESKMQKPGVFHTFDGYLEHMSLWLAEQIRNIPE